MSGITNSRRIATAVVGAALATGAFATGASAFPAASGHPSEAVTQPVAPTQPAAPPVDLRSPDARDAAREAEGTSAPLARDLRSPDARDAAEGRGTTTAPQVEVVKLTAPSTSEPSGFDWGDAGIGAGGVLGLTLLGMGGTFVLIRRHHSGAKPSAAIG